ncbi:hypothetical protein [Ureibacillus sp. GCM10028918]|uniref:hypothetical protein n=1 Tax=Ureibacillus sp. GCM10028918 TaxID=3273429 RepID=UPI0036F23259
MTIKENSLYIEHLTSDNDGQIVKSHLKFDFKKFLKAIDKGFSDYIDKQNTKGVIPIQMGEAIEGYNEFSNIIEKNLN